MKVTLNVWRQPAAQAPVILARRANWQYDPAGQMVMAEPPAGQ